MKQILVAVLMSTILVSGAVSPAGAEVGWTKYHLKVGKVARKMDCTDLRKRTGPSKLTLSTGRSDLAGHAVDVYTFKSRRQQKAWTRKIRSQLAAAQGAQYLAVATGVVVAPKGRRPAAGLEAAVHVLDCEVVAY